MADEKLLACPFCGGEAEIIEPSINKYGNPQWSIRCADKWHADIQEDYKEQAIEAWNKRV